jgi:predicted RNase H-like nuclease (RuvC/YqgF family)
MIMIDRETYSQIESLEYDMRELNDDLSDLRRDVEQYDDEHRAALEQLTRQVQEMAELINRLAKQLATDGRVAPVSA